jgi:hypothetical protein
MGVPEELSREVRTRARARCQYCLMHESLQGAAFHIEHIVPQSKGGISGRSLQRVERSFRHE